MAAKLRLIFEACARKFEKSANLTHRISDKFVFQILWDCRGTHPRRRAPIISCLTRPKKLLNNPTAHLIPAENNTILLSF